MTDHPLPPPVPPQEKNPSKGRNCWIVGCGGCLGVILLLILAGALISWSIKRNLMVEPFEPVEVSETERSQADRKLDAMKAAGPEESDEWGIPEGGITLSEKEVNYLIARNDPELADSLRLDFEPGEVHAEFRVRTEDGDKRHLLKGSLGVQEKDGVLDIRLLDVRLGNFSLPEVLMKLLAGEDFGKEFFGDLETRKVHLENVEKIEIRKDEILIVPKAKPAP